MLQGTLPVVPLQIIHHRGSQWILIAGENTMQFTAEIRQIPGRRYSATYKSWLLPPNRQSFNQLTIALKNKANIDATGLKAGRQVVQNQTTSPCIENKVSKTQPFPPTGVYRINNEVLPQMLQHLELKSYSASTIRTYINEMAQFLKAIKCTKAESFTSGRLKDYLQYCHGVLRLSENTIHSRMNALKFYYEQVLKREKLFWEIPRPKKPFLLPKLLNEMEIAKLFNSLTNRKHKSMLFLAYSAGLRVSEIVALKIADIDSTRMQIFVGRAKGKKDRYVNLSPVVLDILRKYIKDYKPRPLVYLFESDQTFTAYPTRTVQQIFTNAKHKAGIRKEVGVHSLRHSFATHLLEKGTDIKYIKELLGHFNIKTTERYLHVSKKHLVNIISPFDDLWNKDGIEW